MRVRLGARILGWAWIGLSLLVWIGLSMESFGSPLKWFIQTLAMVAIGSLGYLPVWWSNTGGRVETEDTCKHCGGFVHVARATAPGPSAVIPLANVLECMTCQCQWTRERELLRRGKECAADG